MHVYEDYLEQMWKESGKEIDCIGVSHLGHSQTSLSAMASNPDEMKAFDVSDQVDNVCRVLDALVEQNPKTKLVLGGHSVGAFICVEVLKQWEKRRKIARVLCLFPTLHHIG